MKICRDYISLCCY